MATTMISDSEAVTANALWTLIKPQKRNVRAYLDELIRKSFAEDETEEYISKIDTPRFRKDAKRLGKKYKSLANDFMRLYDELQNNTLLGVDLGRGVRKVRLAITSKGKGKSGGARVTTYTDAVFSVDEGEVVLLTIYDKSERETITESEIKELLTQL